MTSRYRQHRGGNTDLAHVRHGHRQPDEGRRCWPPALLSAARQWPAEGRPDDPRAGLIRVGARRLVDTLRSDASRRAREETDARRTPLDATTASPEQPR